MMQTQTHNGRAAVQFPTVTRPVLSVVIIDDQEIGRVSMERLVRNAESGVKLASFTNAPAAYRWICSNRTDLVITDVVMPGKYDGIELLRRLKSDPATNDISVVVVTATDDEQTRNAALSYQAIDCIAKPSDASQIQWRVKNVLAIARSDLVLKLKTQEIEKASAALRTMQSEHEARLLKDARVSEGNAIEKSRETAATFVAMVSHELRTPLHSIISTIETLEHRLNALPLPPDELEPLRRPMSRLKNDSEWLMGQAAELAAFIRAESGNVPHRPRRIYLPDFADDVIAPHLQIADAKNLKVSAQASGVDTVVDVMRLRQIAANLISNAVKYTPAGTVSILLDMVPSRGAGGSELSLIVSDTGIGIPEDLLPKVFEPWERGEAVDGQQGLGLGLSIVRKLVSAMGGSIALSSKVGLGTIVKVAVPVLCDAGALGKDS